MASKHPTAEISEIDQILIDSPLTCFMQLCTRYTRTYIHICMYELEYRVTLVKDDWIFTIGNH